MPDITLTFTAQQAQRLRDALDERYTGSQTLRRKLLFMVRDFVREYTRGERARQDADARSVAYENEEDWTG